MAHQEYIRIVPGSKYAVLMLHGILGTPDHFRELLPLVPENWSVHALLLDGHGGAVEDFSHTSMEKWLTLAGDKEKYIYLPAFVSHKGLAEFGQIVDRFDGIYSDGLVGVSVSTLHRKPLWLAVDSNITNSTSFAIAKRYADRITVSKEITLAEARDMLDAGAYYYTAGSIRVMEFEYCPKGYSCRNCDKGDFTLTDYKDRVYKVRRYSLDGCHFEMYYDTPLKVKRHHYNRLLNGLTLSCDEINAMIEGKPFATTTPGHSEIPVQ